MRRPMAWLAAGVAAVGLMVAVPEGAVGAGSPIPAKERAAAQKAHAEIVRQFGGEVEGPLATYVKQVGLRVALLSVPGSRPEDWTVTLLDSPVPNAMAIPGGNIYITRGLLGMINNEAELASVLGHEAGHVAGRHSAKRQGRALAGMAATIGAAILGGSQMAQMVNYGSTALVSGYSRDQERDADARGLKVAADAGYDPRSAGTMLEALERVAAVEGRQERSGQQSIFATHPVTRDRVERVNMLAAKMPDGGNLGRAPFLAAIDGMTFGDSVEQGIISGPSFRHAGLRLAFDAPPGFVLQNSPQAVQGQARDGSKFLFQGVPARQGEQLDQVVQNGWYQLTNGRVPQVRYDRRRMNGMDVVVSEARLSSGGRPVDLGIAAFRMAPDQVYMVTTLAPAGRGQNFESLLTSFRTLSPAEVAAASRGRKIDVVVVKRGDTVDGLAARMAPPYARSASFLALNGIENRPLVPGERLKLIVSG